MKKAFAWFVLTVALALAGGWWLVRGVGETVVPASDLVVRPGDSLRDLPGTLGISVSSTLYRLYLRAYFPNYSLQAGEYRFESGSTLREVFSTALRTPKSSDVALTVLPGWNLYDIDRLLSERGFIASGALSRIDPTLLAALRVKYPFLGSASSLEGFLYPDTYRVLPQSDLATIVGRMLDGFASNVADRTTLSGKALYDTMILASIVEREERVTANKPVVAGILAKRLKEGIALGADATVCYAYALTHDACTPAFIGEHIGIRSDYNTRVDTGLPPTPISSFTAESFDAAAHPQSSSYYYYLHDDDGVIRYARTLAEHNENRRRYLSK